MDIVKIVGIGLLGAMLAITVKKQAPEIALQVSLAASALIALLLLENQSYCLCNQCSKGFYAAVRSGLPGSNFDFKGGGDCLYQ